MSASDDSATDGNDERVFVLDQIDARPGQAAAVRAAYLADYAPAARERGMTLLHDWITPPLTLPDHGSRLTFVWAVAGTEGWWRMRLTASFDPRVKSFWDGLHGLVERRERSFHEAAARHV